VKNRFYNPELDQGDDTPQWTYGILAVFETLPWALCVGFGIYLVMIFVT